jgi:hypothetical protein
VLFQLQQVSMVLGLRLPGGTDVVVKARARPLTPVVGVGSLAVHADFEAQDLRWHGQQRPGVRTRLTG